MVDANWPGFGHPWVRSLPPDIRNWLWGLWLRTGGEIDQVVETAGESRRRTITLLPEETGTRLPVALPGQQEEDIGQSVAIPFVEGGRLAPVPLQEPARDRAPVPIAPPGVQAGDDRSGVATLVAGTVTVNSVWVTDDTMVFLTGQNSPPVGSAGHLYVSGRTAGTSFTITSTDVTDDRDVAWLLIEPE